MYVIKQFLKNQLLKRQYRKQHISIAKHVDLQNVKLEPYVNIAHHAQVGDATVGKRSSIGRFSKVRYAEIGRYCSISWDVTIGAIEHPLHALSTHAFPYRKRFGLCDKDRQIEHRTVVIGNDVWIGCGAIIMPGVEIGDGAVVGAGSVVTHPVAPYEIVGGSPARHISWRFPKQTIELLEKLRWWDAPDTFLREHIEAFSPDHDISADDSVLKTLIEEMDGKT